MTTTLSLSTPSMKQRINAINTLQLYNSNPIFIIIIICIFALGGILWSLYKMETATQAPFIYSSLPSIFMQPDIRFSYYDTFFKIYYFIINKIRNFIKSILDSFTFS
jgi:hypothetical protein